MYRRNLTRYQIGDRVILGKFNERNDYPLLEATIIAKAPKMVKIETTETDSYFGANKERWLSAVEWYVVCRYLV